jgi:hypothetical protein
LAWSRWTTGKRDQSSPQSFSDKAAMELARFGRLDNGSRSRGPSFGELLFRGGPSFWPRDARRRWRTKFFSRKLCLSVARRY